MAEARPHGDRRTYRSLGCRCVKCRAANAAYERARCTVSYPDPGEQVDAAPVVAYLATLRSHGVGYKQAATLAGVGTRFVKNVRLGRHHTVRADLATRMLGIQPVLAHGQQVTAWRTWRFLDSLLGEGYSHTALALFLGVPQLRLDRRVVTVRTALRVKGLWQRIMAEDGGAVLIGGDKESRVATR